MAPHGDTRDQMVAQIQQGEARLHELRQHISSLSDTLRQLRSEEEELQGRVFTWKQQINSVQERQMKTKIATLQGEMEHHDHSLAELQAAFERALADKLRLQEEMDRVLNQSDAAAGRRQESATVPNSRYDLASTTTVMSGRSYDPLSQSAVPVVNQFQDARERNVRVLEHGVPTTDQIGMHISASPFVNPDEYVVEGRPATQPASESSRFSDWRRPSSRVSQPPGGRSQIIFG
jgi:predicted RNase H-like nuclease (RuvC/YqgF family)